MKVTADSQYCQNKTVPSEINQKWLLILIFLWIVYCGDKYNKYKNISVNYLLVGAFLMNSFVCGVSACTDHKSRIKQHKASWLCCGKKHTEQLHVESASFLWGTRRKYRCINNNSTIVLSNTWAITNSFTNHFWISGCVFPCLVSVPGMLF